LREYKAIQAQRKLEKAIEHWREAKLPEYKRWLRRHKTERREAGRAEAAAAKAEEAVRRERYLCSLR
jgi:hypothetical protein